MSGAPVVIGSRGSKLALWQSEHVKAQLTALHPGCEFRLEIIHTKGDKILDVALSKIGDKGLFTKEIEQALLDRKIDIAVHSLKDMPTQLAGGLGFGAVSERVDVRDAWIGKNGIRFDDLPHGAAIATGSLRRRCQIRALRPDVEIEEMRGNLDTRLRRLRESDTLQGIVLASAGIERLGWGEVITHKFEPERMLPAVGQGALAVQTRLDDERTNELVRPLMHEPTRAATAAERALLRRLEGGCQIPIGAFGRVEGGRLLLDALVGSLDGRRVVRDQISGDAADAEALGVTLAEKLLAAGAGAILSEILALGVRP